MNVLLDTGIALMAISDDPRLSKNARDLIESPCSTIWVSAASLWEIAEQRASVPHRMPIGAPQAHTYFLSAGYQTLSVSSEILCAAVALPSHHASLVDRVLVAQAIDGPMTLLTGNPFLTNYRNSGAEIIMLESPSSPAPAPG